MSSLQRVIKLALGPDPITGFGALQELITFGEEGEEALLSHSVADRPLQVTRRLLRYVASREETIVHRLVDRLAHPERGKSVGFAPILFAGLADRRAALNAVYPLIMRTFTPRLQPGDLDYADVLFHSWGYAGGDGGTLWLFLRKDDYALEKLYHRTCRAACIAFARSGDDHFATIAEMMMHGWEDGFVEISNSPSIKLPRRVAAPTGYSEFIWHRGAVADQILRWWSDHAHWRVREFGALVLSVLGFQRTVTAIVEWLGREPVSSVREPLLHALERSETTPGADALLDHLERFGSGNWERHIAKAAWRASEKARALKVLTSLAKRDDSVGAEACLSLARLGEEHPRVKALLYVPDDYVRVNAALALAYLRREDSIDVLLTRRREAATPLERIGITAALAILGNADEAATLHMDLCAAAGDPDLLLRVDVFTVHRYLQNAILDAFKASEAPQLLSAWRAEMKPLDVQASPIPPKTDTGAANTAPASPMEEIRPSGASAVLFEPRSPTSAKAAAGVVSISAQLLRQAPRVFLSYSWGGEERQGWVRRLAEDLRQNGVEVTLDQWHLRTGGDIAHFMEQGISSADFVLLVCTPDYAVKFDNRRGGVAHEGDLLLGELLTSDSARGRIIPLLREGEPAEALPRYLKTKLYIDFRDDGAYGVAQVELLRRLHDRPRHAPPPLGPVPDFDSMP